MDWSSITHVLERCYTCISCISRGECCAMPFKVCTRWWVFSWDLRHPNLVDPVCPSHDVKFPLIPRHFYWFFLLFTAIDILFPILCPQRNCFVMCARDPVLFFDFFLVFHTQYACAPSRGIIRVDSVDSVSRKNQEQLQEPFRPTSTYHLVVMSSSWLLWTFFCNSLRECNAWLYAARLTVEIIYDIWYSTPLLVLGLAHSIGPIYPVCSTV